MVALPQFFKDKYYDPTQESLFKTGGDILGGNMNEYYKPIGEIGGQTFEDMIRGVRTDISKSVLEDAAKRRSRGGNYAIAEAMAKVTPQLREQERTRALTARERLLGKGIDTMGGVRSAGMTMGEQVNTYNLNAAKLKMMEEEIEANKKAAKNKMLGDIIGSGIGMASNIYGIGQLKNVLGSANTNISSGRSNTGWADFNAQDDMLKKYLR